MPTKPDTPATTRRVVWPTSEQMLKVMAQAADEQRRVSAGVSAATTQKPREGALKRAVGVSEGRQGANAMNEGWDD